jgi:hypothetical protein
VIQQSQGLLHQGNVLVSNFNNSSNFQGTGSTIVQISPTGQVSLFAHISPNGLPGPCPGGIGLTTALVIINNWVIVGSTPSANGQAATAQRGCLLVLDSSGRVRETFSGGAINGPWDATAVTNGLRASLFVSNVLNGTVAAGGRVVFHGTVLRLALRFFPDPNQMPMLTGFTVVASNLAERTDPNAFVVGPTGLGIGSDGSLFIADTVENRIAQVRNALTRPTSGGVGTTLTSRGLLNGPLGMAIAPNSDILTANGGDGQIVETTPLGAQIDSHFLNITGSPPGAGALFGLAVAPQGAGVYFVDDDLNQLKLLF